MTWRYAILETTQEGGDPSYEICEQYDIDRDNYKAILHTGPMTLAGDSPEELVEFLELALKDAGRCIADSKIIGNDGTYIEI